MSTTPGPGGRPLLVIANTGSGALSENGGCERLEAALKIAGLQAEVAPVSSEAEMEAALGGPAAQCGTVIAAGGDGTINAVAGRLPEQACLGVIPAGTFNHFARDLGIPMDFEGAARVIRAGATRAVDIGDVNGRIFLNNSSLGIYPRIVSDREAMQKRGLRKRAATALAGLAALLRPPSMSVELDIEGAAFRRTTPFVFIGNNIYETEGRRLGARNRLDAGVLCIWVARAGGRVAIFRTALAGLLGRLKNSRELDMLSARDAWINAGQHAVSVSIDGEVISLKSPLHYRIRHGALRVFAPAGEAQG